MSSEHIYFHFKNEIYIQIKSELKKKKNAGQGGSSRSTRVLGRVRGPCWWGGFNHVMSVVNELKSKN